MIRRKKIHGVIAAVLTVVSLVSLLSVLAVGAEGDVLDYSRPGSQYTKELSSPDIVERILDTVISDEERAYLVSYSDKVIRYDDGIPTSAVLAEYSEGTLSVSAYEYTYTTSDGASVVWVPTAATLNGAKHTLVKSARNSYDTTFTSVSDEDDTQVVRISYELKVKISADLANSLV